MLGFVAHQAEVPVAGRVAAAEFGDLFVLGGQTGEREFAEGGELGDLGVELSDPASEAVDLGGGAGGRVLVGGSGVSGA